MLRTLLLAILVFASASPVIAQQPEQPAAAADTMPRDSTAAADTGKAQVGRALVEVLILNTAAVFINHLARDIPTAGPNYWWRNIRGGWEWDDNNISTNNIEHPYGGAVYYNVARANKLSFWAAAPVTVAGSLMWELLGEASPPSYNDLIVTSLSGINLGEPTRRLSILVLDNEATGINRAWREATVLLLNPGLGLDRLSRGQTWQRRPNPSDRRPATLRGFAAAGAKRMTLPAGSSDPRMDVAAAAFGLQYGDPFTDAVVQPFSYFTFTAELNSGPSTTLTELGTRGLLAPLTHRASSTKPLAGIFMDFEYQWNEAYQFSYQSFGIGSLSRTSGTAWRLNTDISAEFVPLMASSDRYAKDRVNRSYDFGIGIGGRAFGQLEHRGFRVLTAGYRAYWAATVNGASQDKLVQFATVEARAPLPLGLAVGAAYTLYLQRSTYAERTTATVSLPALSLFISTSGR